MSLTFWGAFHPLAGRFPRGPPFGAPGGPPWAKQPPICPWMGPEVSAAAKASEWFYRVGIALSSETCLAIYSGIDLSLETSSHFTQGPRFRPSRNRGARAGARGQAAKASAH